MPAYLVYVLIILALSTAAGVGFKAGSDLVQMFTAIGFGVVIIALWEPLIKPLIERITKK
jgi:hypothetical protein